MGFAEEIKALRLAKGWSQQELADKAGVSRGAVAKAEGGGSNAETMEALNLVNLAKALGEHPLYFIISNGLIKPEEVNSFVNGQFLLLPENLRSGDIKLLQTIAAHLSGKAISYEENLEVRRQIPMEDSIRESLARQEQVTNLINGGKVIKEGDNEKEKAS